MDKFESSIEEIEEIVTDGERRERERERKAACFLRGCGDDASRAELGKRCICM